MAYNIVINSRFNPFSYDELIKAPIMETQAHQALEAQANELATKAGIWENVANEQTDPYSYKMYKTYANDLEAKAGQLSREGLTLSNRKGILDMKARYGKEIVPIENAYQARAEEIKEQTAGRASGLVYAGDASTSSLDRYLKNPSIKYGFADSREGYERLYKAASALAHELKGYGKGQKLDDFTNTFLQRHGYKSSEISQVISDMEEALRGGDNIRGNSVLSSLLANEMQVSGVNTWTDKAAQLDYYNRVAPALYQAVGQTNVSTFADYGATHGGGGSGGNKILSSRKPNFRTWAGFKHGEDFNGPEYQKILEAVVRGQEISNESFTFSEAVRAESKKQANILRDKYNKERAKHNTHTPSVTSLYQSLQGANYDPNYGVDYNYEAILKKVINNIENSGKSHMYIDSKLTKALENLGFSADKPFTSEDVVREINRRRITQRPLGLNMANVKYQADIMKAAEKRLDKVYNLDKGKDEKPSDKDIRDFAYFLDQPYKIVYEKEDGQRYAAPLSSYSPDLEKIVESVLTNPNYKLFEDLGDPSGYNIPEIIKSPEGADLVSNYIGELIESYMNNYNPVQSTTENRNK